ncbi:MAG TPA: Gfo/Idh/MocA family oxidoreductase, partial [Victivallales bacterium]|nr:Gfo/Idh/MocA family oxidoreductase [Victivallales bacterium]
MNYQEAVKMFEAADKAKLMLMEAFMYRCHPQTAKLVEILRENTIGDVRLIQAAFCFSAGFKPEGRLFNKRLGGGGILDVGCYPISLSRLIAGVAEGGNFVEPTEIKGVACIGQTGVDEWAAGALKFESGIIAQVACGIRVGPERSARIYGSNGSIFMPSPWVASRKEPEQGRIILQINGKDSEEIIIQAAMTSFTYEIDAFGEAVFSGKLKPIFPAMSAEDSLGNMLALDSWRNEVGCAYEQEKSCN